MAGLRKLIRTSARVALAIANLAFAAGAAALGPMWTSASQAATPGPPVAVSAVEFRHASTALLPGDARQVTATLTNNTTHQLRLDRARIEGQVSNLPRRCLSSWFRFAGDPGPAVALAAKGGTATVGGTLTFVDAATDQAACAGATPTLSLHVSS